MKFWIALIRGALAGWAKDKVSTLSAALAYYAAFSLGPLLLVIISLVGLVASRQGVQSEIMTEVQGLVGVEGANFVRTVIANSDKGNQDIWGLLIGLVTVTLGALGVFGQLRDSLNLIWGVTAKPGFSLWRIIRSRALSMGLVVVVALLLLMSLVISAVINGFAQSLASYLPLSVAMVEVLNFVLSLIVTSLLFACVFVVLPDIKVPWRAALLGALISALLFSLGKSLIGMYIGMAASTSTYGSAGSLIAILLWVYYTAQILFLGAEFVKEYMDLKKVEIVPIKEAVRSEAQLRQASQPESAVYDEELEQPYLDVTNSNHRRQLAIDVLKAGVRGMFEEVERKSKQIKVGSKHTD